MGFWSDLLKWIKDALDYFWSGITRLFDWIYDVGWKTVRNIIQNAEDVWDWAVDEAYDAVNWVEDASAYLSSWVLRHIEDAIDWVEDASDYISRWVMKHVEDAIEWVEAQGVSIWNWMQTAATAAVNWVNSNGANILNSINKLFADLANIPAMIGTKISEFWNSVKDTIKTIIPQFILDAVSWINTVALPAINDFINLFPQLFNAFWDFFTAPFNLLEDKFEDWVASWTPTRTEINARFIENNPLPQ